VFDFDETIIDLEREHAEAHAALCRDLGADYDALPADILFSSGTRIIDDIRGMRAHFGWTDSEDQLFARRQEHFDAICAGSDLETMPGVRETIRALASMSVPLAIASSAVRSSIEVILDRLGLRDAFALIVDGGEVEEGKPDPEAFLLTARKLGVAPAECLVFEDSHFGVVAARRAGMFCVAVPNPRAQTPQDLSAADLILGRMDEVLTFLAAIR
jgi:HAD superfamily hydrolase (TIGR01509 family)